MQPIDEKKDNVTSAHNEKLKKNIDSLVSSFDELTDVNFKFHESNLTIKKIRKKNTHLTPKKKKRN